MSPRYRVGIGSDLFAADGSLLLADAVATCSAPVPGLELGTIGQPRAELTPSDVGGCDAVITLWQRVTPGTLAGVERLATIARWGVGVDMIDLDACTERDVLVSITRDAVRRPVAEAILTYVLVLAKRVLHGDRLVRTGQWDEKEAPGGIGLRGKVLGTIGVGNIGAGAGRLLQPLGFARILAFDPYVARTRRRGWASSSSISQICSGTPTSCGRTAP